MKLTLKILSYKGQPVSSQPVTFGEKGGSIGRSKSCHLVLDDAEQIISRGHAVILCQQGQFYFQDKSANGSELEYQGRTNTIHQSTHPTPLYDGMRLKIGAYEIAVGVIADPVISAPVPAPSLNFQEPPPSLLNNPPTATSSLLGGETNFEPLRAPSYSGSLLEGDDVPLHQSHITPESPSPATSVFDQVIFTPPLPIETLANALFEPQHISDLRADPVAVNLSANAPSPFGMPAPSEPTPAFTSEANPFSSPTASIFNSLPQAEPATPFSSPLTNPSLLQPEYAPVPPVFQPPVSPLTSPVDSPLWAAFLQGAGVNSLALSPEQQIAAMQQIGVMFAQFTNGTFTLLKNRADFKKSCKINRTQIHREDNNQLKFASSTDELLRQLLANNSAGFLDANTAIKEAFSDLMAHQMAMQAGIQASLTQILRTFDPKRIESRCEQGFSLQKKSKCWESYEESYPQFAEDAVEYFYGEEFVDAYEKQMNTVKFRR